MTRAIAIALAVAAVVACNLDRFVLTEGPGTPVTSCDEVWSRGRPGGACDFAGSCERETGDRCCTGFAACRDGHLLIETTCACADTRCASDAECAHAITLCGDGGTCVECPSIESCPRCPDGLERRTRNGCETCTCTPPSQCELGRPCERVAGGTCYPGAACADGCVAGDSDCCANACAAPGCAGPAPLGCRATWGCDASCTSCVATECDCYDGTWRCSVECIPDARPTCTYE